MPKKIAPGILFTRKQISDQIYKITHKFIENDSEIQKLYKELITEDYLDKMKRQAAKTRDRFKELSQSLEKEIEEARKYLAEVKMTDTNTPVTPTTPNAESKIETEVKTVETEAKTEEQSLLDKIKSHDTAIVLVAAGLLLLYIVTKLL